MKALEILSHVDHTLLSPTATWNEMRILAEESLRYHTASVCVPPAYIARLRKEFGKELTICTVIGFPLGYDTTAAKCIAADEAVNISSVLFTGAVQNLTASQIEEILGSLKMKLPEEINLVDLLVLLGAAKSKTEARTFISQNSVSINGEKVTDAMKNYTIADAMAGKYLIVRRGKKNYYLGEF